LASASGSNTCCRRLRPRHWWWKAVVTRWASRSLSDVRAIAITVRAPASCASQSLTATSTSGRRRQTGRAWETASPCRRSATRPPAKMPFPSGSVTSTSSLPCASVHGFRHRAGTEISRSPRDRLPAGTSGARWPEL